MLLGCETASDNRMDRQIQGMVDEYGGKERKRERVRGIEE
jgi:hypothetical protein